MSLIPSESLSFPDDFSRSISRARVLYETQKFIEANKPKQAKRDRKTAVTNRQQQDQLSFSPAPAQVELAPEPPPPIVSTLTASAARQPIMSEPVANETPEERLAAESDRDEQEQVASAPAPAQKIEMTSPRVPAVASVASAPAVKQESPCEAAPNHSREEDLAVESNGDEHDQLAYTTLPMQFEPAAPPASPLVSAIAASTPKQDILSEPAPAESPEQPARESNPPVYFKEERLKKEPAAQDDHEHGRAMASDPVPRRFSPAPRLKPSTRIVSKMPRPVRLPKSGPVPENSRHPKPSEAGPEVEAESLPAMEPAAELMAEMVEPDLIPEQLLLLDALPPAYEIRTRWRRKLVRFLICEFIALAILAGCIVLAYVHRIDAQLAATAIDVGTISAAFAVAVLPILFYGLPSKVP